MYNSFGVASASLGAGSVGLAATGMNLVWLVLAAFALLGAGQALLRLAPRREA